MEALIGVFAWGLFFGAGFTMGKMIITAVLDGIALGVVNWWRGENSEL